MVRGWVGEQIHAGQLVCLEIAWINFGFDFVDFDDNTRSELVRTFFIC